MASLVQTSEIAAKMIERVVDLRRAVMVERPQVLVVVTNQRHWPTSVLGHLLANFPEGVAEHWRAVEAEGSMALKAEGTHASSPCLEMSSQPSGRLEHSRCCWVGWQAGVVEAEELGQETPSLIY
jgi:hypothetical protein